MRMYGKTLYTVLGKSENIKITTPDDYYVFKALLEAKEARKTRRTADFGRQRTYAYAEVKVE